jgi:hypothetical protein
LSVIPGVNLGLDSSGGVYTVGVGLAGQAGVVVGLGSGSGGSAAGEEVSVIVGDPQTVSETVLLTGSNPGVYLNLAGTTVPVPLPAIGLDTAGGVDVVSFGPGTGTLVAVDPTSPAAEAILGGMETIYAGGGEVALGGLTSKIPGLENPVSLPFVGIDTAGGVGALSVGIAGTGAVVAVDPTNPAAQVILAGIETVYGSSDGTVSVHGITDSIPGLSTLLGTSSPFSTASHGADTISMGMGTDTVVEPGRATVASLSAIGKSAFAGVDSISGGHNVLGSVPSVDQIGGAIGHDVLSSISTSNLFGFGTDSAAGAHLASGLVSGGELTQVVTPVHTDLTHTDGSAGHSLVSMDGGLTTIELKGVSHVTSSIGK